MLSQLRFRINSQRSQKQPGGEMQLDGQVREAPVVDSLEAALDDAQHSVKGQGREHDLKRQKYPWQFRSSVVVEKPKK
jgi:hypothetical protein